MANHENNIYTYKIRDPSYWGPQFWNFLYLTALGLPISFTPLQKQEFSRLLQNFHIFLPCQHCRFHYATMVRDMQIEVSGRGEALNLINFLHNNVRKRLKKNAISVKEVINKNSSFYNSHGSLLQQFMQFVVHNLNNLQC